MSMSPEQDNFESLRRLLVLKRYEQPPPGYFNGFSRDVLARIRAGERVDEPDTLERLYAEAPWLRRLLSALEARPIWAGAFGVAVCGLLVAGIVYSESPDTGAVAHLQTPDAAFLPQAVQVAASEPTMNASIDIAPPSALVSPGAVLNSEAAPSLFQEFKDIQKPWVVPASYSAPAGQ